MVAMQHYLVGLALGDRTGGLEELPEPVVLLVQVPDEGDVLELPALELLVELLHRAPSTLLCTASRWISC